MHNNPDKRAIIALNRLNIWAADAILTTLVVNQVIYGQHMVIAHRAI